MYQSLIQFYMYRILFCFILFGISALSAQTNRFIWQEGERQHTVYLNSNFVAEIQSQGNQSHEKKAKILSVTDAKLKSSLLKGSLPNTHKGTYSEVFEEGEGGRKMTLPGDIFIEFDSDWNEDKVKDWALREKLTIVQKLNSTKNLYRIQSATGVESLLLANSLLSQSGIKAAFPNWWRESVRR